MINGSGKSEGFWCAICAPLVRHFYDYALKEAISRNKQECHKARIIAICEYL